MLKVRVCVFHICALCNGCSALGGRLPVPSPTSWHDTQSADQWFIMKTLKSALTHWETLGSQGPEKSLWNDRVSASSSGILEIMRFVSKWLSPCWCETIQAGCPPIRGPGQNILTNASPKSDPFIPWPSRVERHKTFNFYKICIEFMTSFELL